MGSGPSRRKSGGNARRSRVGGGPRRPRAPSATSNASPETWDKIRHLLPPTGLPVETSLELMRRHCDLTVSWNRSHSNLISKNDEPRIVTRHVVESIEPASWLASFRIADWIDFGSGAGFPAIPLAIAGLGSRWLLVESRRPKVLFLKKLLMELGIEARVSAVHSRLELLADQLPPAGGFTSRATARLEPTLELASRFVARGGSAFLWKGTSWRVEMHDGAPWESNWTFDRAQELSGGLVVVRFERL